MFWKLERTSGSWQALLALMKNWMISWVVHLLLRCLNPFLLLVTRSNYPPHLPLAGQALAACGSLPCFVWWCEIPTEVLRILSRSWFPIFSVHSRPDHPAIRNRTKSARISMAYLCWSHRSNNFSRSFPWTSCPEDRDIRFRWRWDSPAVQSHPNFFDVIWVFWCLPF